MNRWPAHLREALVVVALLLLGGCALPIASDVTVFHEWPDQAPRSYRFAATEAQLDSLEHASYRALMRAELARVGFVETAQAPRFEVRIEFSTEPRTQRRIEYSNPDYLQPWFYWGSFGSGGGFSLAAPFPGFGYGPYAVERAESWYEYRLSVEIGDLAAGGRNVYEASAVTGGISPSIADAMPYLVRSVFTDFPGRSGVTRHVQVPRDAVAH
jgi:hypothetical protein